MGAVVRPTVDETDNLLSYLDSQRDTFRYIAHGLTDEQARLRPTAGTLSIGGLIKHVAAMERSWQATMTGNHETEVDYEGGFTMGPDQTVAELLADLNRAGVRTRRLVEELGVDHPVPVPKDVPWFPKDVDAWSVRWVLTHLMEELARHAGHADIVRESIDGRTMYELQAMADGWYEQYQAMVSGQS